MSPQPRLLIAVLAATLLGCEGAVNREQPVLADQPALSMTPAPGVAALLEVPFSTAELTAILRLSPLPATPSSPTNAHADNPAAAWFGRWLFFDTRLSRDDTMSCATCHVAEREFADGLSLGQGRTLLGRHTPHLWNVGWQRWMFWDGRRDSLWSQALVPIEHPREMGHDRTAVVHLIHDDPELRAGYEAVFGAMPDVSDARRFPPHARPIPRDEDHPHSGPRQLPPEHEHDYHPHQLAWSAMSEGDRDVVNRVFANVGKAMAAYERLLVADDAPFDTFVSGLRSGDAAQLESLGADAQLGLKRFLGPGRCSLCHSGPAFSDLEFHNALVPPLGGREDDRGRYAGVAEVRRHEFRGTGPYSDAPQSDEARKIDWLVDASGAGHLDVQDQFKTPGLRNVARTAPFGHHGQMPDLEAVLEHYSTHADAPSRRGHVERFFQPLDLDRPARTQLIAFLESLSDRSIEAELLAPPASPVPPPELLAGATR